MNFLIKEHKSIDDIIAELTGDELRIFDTDKQILENNLFGVDINEESVEIAKLSLWLRTAQKGRKLSDLNNNIKCGNSLIEDKEVAGDKAFNWNVEFKDIMDNGGFDVVIGNPPYIFARGNNFKDNEKKYYYEKYKLQEYQINTYILFTEKGFSLLKQNGIFGLIIPNNWQTIDTCRKFRKYILENLSNIKIINSKDKIFEDANVDNGILIANINNFENSYEFIELEKQIFKPIEKGKNFQNENFIINFKLLDNKKNLDILNKINIKSQKLENIVNVKSGLKAYEIGKGNPFQTIEIKNNRVYHKNKKEKDNDFLYLEGKDVLRYGINQPKQFLEYGKNLAAPRSFGLFAQERILVRQIPSPYPKCINAVQTKQTYLNDINSMVIFSFNKNYFSKYILSLLNSKLISFWFVNTFDKLQRGLFPQFKVKELAIFPIKKIPSSQQQPFIDKADIMLSLNKQLQTKKTKFLTRIKDNLSIPKITKKLDTFYIHDFKTFISELKKQ
ncbi:MAG: hypothetical protein GY830_05705, partial [Bacteroidetes bacterium]|nr:hypothetical protein [Bacteroidota bacterium]